MTIWQYHSILCRSEKKSVLYKMYVNSVPNKRLERYMSYLVAVYTFYPYDFVRVGYHVGSCVGIGTALNVICAVYN